MGDTKMFLFFSNVSTINAFISEIVFYGIWTVNLDFDLDSS